MKGISFDFNNLFSFNLGKVHGVTEADLKDILPLALKAHRHLEKIVRDKRNRTGLSLEWTTLPFQDKATVQEIQGFSQDIARKFENVLFLGIGGSYLGLLAAQDALAPTYYNDFSRQRNGRPRIYFEGNNLDPDTLGPLLKNLNPKKTFIVVISKSGETTETKATFEIVEPWLRRAVGKFYGRQIVAITDPSCGTLRQKVNQEQAKDVLSFRNLPLLKGVGGRFSELNMGLLHLAIIGIRIQEVLNGAQAMAKRCSLPSIFKNPACLYAALQYILYKKKGKNISVLMPFSETLKATADWYVQLLAESLGKKYTRKIRLDKDGREFWEENKNAVINTGRTPLPSRGTNDLHSIQQNNIEGENNKSISFIKLDKFKHDLKIPAFSGDFLSGKSYSHLMHLAQEATQWALVCQQRPNCTIILPEVNPYYWGGLIYFFEMATAYEGELLNVNAFNQPGVESYKNYMDYKLGKAGVPSDSIAEIKQRHLEKRKKFILQ